MEIENRMSLFASDYSGSNNIGIARISASHRDSFALEIDKRLLVLSWRYDYLIAVISCVDSLLNARVVIWHIDDHDGVSHLLECSVCLLPHPQ